MESATKRKANQQWCLCLFVIGTIWADVCYHEYCLPLNSRLTHPPKMRRNSIPFANHIIFSLSTPTIASKFHRIRSHLCASIERFQFAHLLWYKIILLCTGIFVFFSIMSLYLHLMFLLSLIYTYQPANVCRHWSRYQRNNGDYIRACSLKTDGKKCHVAWESIHNNCLAAHTRERHCRTFLCYQQRNDWQRRRERERDEIEIENLISHRKIIINNYGPFI